MNLVRGTDAAKLAHKRRRGPQAWGTLTIRKGARINDPARAKILADWLRRTATLIEEDHADLNPYFRARFLPSK